MTICAACPRPVRPSAPTCASPYRRGRQPVWDVPTAIDWINKFHDFDLAWVEEPTSPDDVIGHATIARAINPIKVATGEQMQSRILYKQYLQANAFGIMQIDATRVAGPQRSCSNTCWQRSSTSPSARTPAAWVCARPCVTAMFDYVAVSGTMDGRMIEYVDNQHEHFVHPTEIRTATTSLRPLGQRYRNSDAGDGREVPVSRLTAIGNS